MSEINVTPFVDVMLVLLIIFMVILPAAVSDMNLELAKMENPDEERKGEPDWMRDFRLRALEVFEKTGQPISRLQRQFDGGRP